MITYLPESVDQLRDDIQPLIEAHWQEIARNKDAIKLNPDYDAYYALELSGKLHCLAVRKDAELIGYAISIIGRHPHYKDHIFATNDILYLYPEHRRGLVGFRLFKEMIKHYKSMLVSIVHIHMKLDFDFSPLLEKLGFKQVESNWELRLV